MYFDENTVLTINGLFNIIMYYFYALFKTPSLVHLLSRAKVYKLGLTDYFELYLLLID